MTETVDTCYNLDIDFAKIAWFLFAQETDFFTVHGINKLNFSVTFNVFS